MRNTQHLPSSKEPAAVCPFRYTCTSWGGRVPLRVGEREIRKSAGCNVKTPNTFWEREKGVMSALTNLHACSTTLGQGASGRGRFGKGSQDRKPICTSPEILIFFWLMKICFHWGPCKIRAICWKPMADADKTEKSFFPAILAALNQLMSPKEVSVQNIANKMCTGDAHPQPGFLHRSFWSQKYTSCEVKLCYSLLLWMLHNK